MPALDYKSSGVDIELGGYASKILYNAAKQTWSNRKGKLGEVVEFFEDFSGLRAVNVGGLPVDTYMNINLDGVGTKIEICERTSRHDTVAYDLFAMVCDDAIVRGAEPVIIGSILDVRSLGGQDNSFIDFVRQLAVGYINAAKEANVAIINGEVAEIGARVSGYGPFNYNWGAGVVSFAKKDRMLTGYKIREGNLLVGLGEQGFRSNGITLLRRVMESAYGKEWQEYIYDSKRIGDLALHPSRIYSSAVVDMFGGLDKEPKAPIHGIAHITGGGIPEKLGRTLKPSGLGAYINNPFEPCSLMKHCQEKGNISDFEAYKIWNMGQGMTIITPSPDDVIKIAEEHGIESKVIGEITKSPNIVIKSRGANCDDEKELFYQV
ncbi:MAG: AIR synthase-related protein [Candidatus Woesearchaeota archaeon]